MKVYLGGWCSGEALQNFEQEVVVNKQLILNSDQIGSTIEMKQALFCHKYFLDNTFAGYLLALG